MKILVVDDEQSIRELLEFNLKKNGYETLTAADGLEALQKAEGTDLILLDLMLPEIDGIEVRRRLKTAARTAYIPIIMLTAKAEEVDRIIGLEMGADDYVAKPFSMRELMARIKAVLRRSSSSDRNNSNVLVIGRLKIDFASYQVWLADASVPLTPKEFDLLKLLVTNQGRAFSRDELLERVWGYEYYGDTRTVDVHIRHLRSKLAADEALSNAIETVRGVGYLFTPKIADR